MIGFAAGTYFFGVRNCFTCQEGRYVRVSTVVFLRHLAGEPLYHTMAASYFGGRFGIGLATVNGIYGGVVFISRFGI